MSNVTKLSLPPRSLAIGAGHELAFEMFDELAGDSADAADQALLESDYRRAAPYRDIVAEYLARARAAGADVERGFTMVLSDLVAQGFVQRDLPSVSYYERLMRRRVIADGPRQAARREKARALRQARREQGRGA